ncbi:MAG: hypothetical protein RIM72_12680 [Alphaproteobacteria bacterium]
MDVMKTHSFDYMHLLDLFDTSVAENLRGTGFSEPFLALWVPDPDPVRSLTGFIHAVSQETEDTVELLLPVDLLSGDDRQRISSTTSADANTDWLEMPDSLILTVTTRSGREKADPAGKEGGLQDVAASSDRPQSLSNRHALNGASILPQVWRSYFAHVRRKDPDRPEDLQTGEWIMHRTDRCWIAFSRSGQIGIVDAKSGVFDDDPVLYGLLSILCDTSIGKPVEEAIAHGLLHVIERCKQALPVTSLPGIVVPVSLGPEFACASELLSLFRQNSAESIPEYDESPSKQWLSMDVGQRQQKLGLAIEQFLCGENRISGDITLLDVRDDLSGWPVRVFVQCGQNVETEKRPDILRKLERFLKQTVDRKLNVFYETAKDANRIRRL